MPRQKFSGMLLRAARKRLFLTQKQLAARVPCNRNTISRAEMGECSDKLAAKVAAAMEMDVAEFYEAMSPLEQLTDDEQEFLLALRELSRDERLAARCFLLGIRAARHPDEQGRASRATNYRGTAGGSEEAGK